MVLEVDLYNLVAQPEHDGVLGPHPLLNVDAARWVLQLTRGIGFVPRNELLLLSWIIVLLQVALEVLQQGDLLLEFRWELSKVVLRHHVLLLVGRTRLALVVVELRARGLCHYLRGIVEENTCRHVGQQVAEPVLGGVVNPLGDPDLSGLVHGTRSLAGSLRSLDLGVVIHSDRLLAQVLASRAALGRGKTRHLLGRGRSDGDWRHHLLASVLPSVCSFNRRHVARPHVVASGVGLSISEVGHLSRGAGSRATVHPVGLVSHDVSWGCVL